MFNKSWTKIMMELKKFYQINGHSNVNISRDFWMFSICNCKTRTKSINKNETP